MPHFAKHFTLAEARATLPELRRLFQELYDLKDAIKALAPKFDSSREAAEGNGGGEKRSVEYMDANVRFQQLMRGFAERGIQIKDVSRGLVDFPHLREGKEVFLCWELGEETISYWHELETGFAGRKLLE